jgi:hypothetical protein
MDRPAPAARGLRRAVRTRGLLLLALAAAVAGLATWAVLRGDALRNRLARVDTRPFAELAAQADAIRLVRLTAPGAITHLERKDGRWQVREKHGYPADTAKLGAVLADFAALRLLEPRTDDPKRYGALDLTPPGEADGRALRIEVYGAGEAPLAALYLGKRREVRGGGVRQAYVRLPDEARTWLAQTALDPPREPSLWLARQVLDIPQAQVRRIRVALYGQQPYTLVRADAQAPFALDPLPAGRTLDAQRANAAAFGLQDLTLQNVFLPAEVDADWAQADVVAFTTADGLEVEMRIVRVHGVPNARIAVRAVADADEAARERAADLAARTQRWVYVLAPHPVSTFARPPEELLAPLAPPPGAGEGAQR